jgi:hypothetical protein
VGSPFLLECGDLSPLFSFRDVALERKKKKNEDQSGDESPHSKRKTPGGPIRLPV